MLHLQLIV